MNLNPSLPLLTIGILSWNRLHYLRATLESAKRCIQYPNIQWIVVDNLSEEPGLTEYLKNQTWVDELVFLKSDHVTAMNEIVARARGEVLLLWPDDIQFIVEGDWMIDCMEILLQNEWVGSMSLNCLRRETIKNWTNLAPNWSQIRPMIGDIKWLGKKFRVPRRLSSARGFSFRTYGWKTVGVIGSGIPSLTRTEVWKQLGPWKATDLTNINDSSGGGETEMLQRWRRSSLPLQLASPILPVAADIINDTLGSKAKIRKNKRYGVYTPPTEGDFYYRIVDQTSLDANRSIPFSFEELVQPIGFNLPLDAHGNLRKAGINLSVVSEINPEQSLRHNSEKVDPPSSGSPK
jgi:glycosyltransferase involved in cell wall biosynthesis